MTLTCDDVTWSKLISFTLVWFLAVAVTSKYYQLVEYEKDFITGVKTCFRIHNGGVFYLTIVIGLLKHAACFLFPVELNLI